MSQIIQILGWYGVIAVLGAYFLLSLSIVKPVDITYHLLNLTGAIGVGIASVAKKDRQPTVINLIWALIAISAIARIILNV